MEDELNEAKQPEESPAASTTTASEPAAATPTAEARTWMMLCHLTGLVGFIGPLIVWLIKKAEMPEVDREGKTALNFQLTLLIAWVAVAIIGQVLAAIVGLVAGPLALIVGGIFGLAYMAIAVAALVFIIMASIKANEGKPYTYPFSLKLVK